MDATKTAVTDRPKLGEFMNVLCFRYLGDGAEELAGDAVIIDAGRKRGRELIEELGLTGSNEDADKLKEQLNAALGEQGTRLCIIEEVKPLDGGGYEVHAIECACTKYTQGVLIGSIGALAGKTMLGKEVSELEFNGRVYHIELF